MPPLTHQYNQRRVPYLIIHGIGTPIERTRQILSGQSELEASAHYFIDTDGDVTHYVDEGNRAWHAGSSYWAGLTDLSSVSIGIEMKTTPDFNDEADFHLATYTAAQMEALATLCTGIVERHKIDPANVLGHQDIAPYRKLDPGPHFDWAFMATRGIGLWHDFTAAASDPQITNPQILVDIKHKLALYGYDPRPNKDDKGFEHVIRAFQMHFMPWAISGNVTAQTVQILDQLLAKRGMAA